MKAETLQHIQSIALKKAKCDEEDFNVDDWAGGNIDDAYNIGNEDGAILFARELLKMLGLDS